MSQDRAFFCALVHETHSAGSDELIYTVGSMYSWGEDMGRILSTQRIIEGSEQIERTKFSTSMFLLISKNFPYGI